MHKFLNILQKGSKIFSEIKSSQVHLPSILEQKLHSFINNIIHQKESV